MWGGGCLLPILLVVFETVSLKIIGRIKTRQVQVQVGDKLDKHFGRRGVFAQNLIHMAALVDTKMRNPKARDEGPGPGPK